MNLHVAIFLNLQQNQLLPNFVNSSTQKICLPEFNQTLEELEAVLVKAERSMNVLKLKLADECQVLRCVVAL